jgi:hypothetical protein
MISYLNSILTPVWTRSGRIQFTPGTATVQCLSGNFKLIKSQLKDGVFWVEVTAVRTSNPISSVIGLRRLNSVYFRSPNSSTE